MKKTGFFKVLASIVALGLLVGALVGINVQAAEDKASAPEIISMNVEYGSELYLLYAVDKATVSGTPKLEIVNADGSAVINTVSDYEEMVVNGTPSYVFKTFGTAPGQLNKAEYVRAVGDNGVGAIVKYSIEDYLYTRLYKNGFAAKTEADGKDFDKRELYFQTLKYGRSAQDVFYASDADKIGNPGIAIKGNGAASGEYAIGDCVVLSAEGIEGFDYWKVTEMTAFGEVLGERKLGAGYEYLAARSAVIVPVTDDDAADGVEAWDSSVISFNSETTLFRNSKDAYGVHERVFDMESGEWYHSIIKRGSTNGSTTFYIYPTGGDISSASSVEIEFDFYVSADATMNIQNHFTVKGKENATSTFRQAPFLFSSYKTLIKGDWNKIKIVYTPTSFADDNGAEDAFTAEYYINGALAESTSANYSIGKDNWNIPTFDKIAFFTFSFNGAARGDFKIDNASFVFK